MSNLIRMVYVSTSTNPVKPGNGGVQKDIGRILMQSRKNNPKDEIGGVLYFRDNYFFQCLEGEQEAVNRLYKSIADDPRHENVQSVSVKRIHKRQFANWSMKYVALEDDVSRLLKENGYASFTPYVFDDDMIDKILGLFTTAVDQTSRPDQNYNATIADDEKPGLFSRLFNRQQAA